MKRVFGRDVGNVNLSVATEGDIYKQKSDLITTSSVLNRDDDIYIHQSALPRHRPSETPVLHF